MSFTLINWPHALYLSDVGAEILQELGIKYTGGIAVGKGTSYYIIDGKKNQMPSDWSRIPFTKNNGDSSEIDGSQFYNSLAKIDFSQLESVTVQEWLDKNIQDKNLAEIIKTNLRLNTYGNDREVQSAGLSFRQISVGNSGGAYVFGWRLADTCRRTCNCSQKCQSKDCHGGKSNEDRKKRFLL